MAPDVADKVLARLGYRPASRMEVVMGAVKAAARRAGSVFCVLILIGVGLFAIDSFRREQAKQSRVDDLVRASVRERGQWIGEVVEGLRPVSQIPSVLLQPSPEPSGVGDGWSRPLPSLEPKEDPESPPEGRATAPFRQT